jgi:hypothetical protein
MCNNIYAKKVLTPPAPVGNTPSQIVNCDGGPKLTAAATKTDNLVKHPSHFSSSSSLQLLQHHLSLKVQFLIDN